MVGFAIDESTIDSRIGFNFRSHSRFSRAYVPEDPTRLDLVGLSHAGTSLHDIADDIDLTQARWVIDPYRSPSGAWRPVAAPPPPRRMYTATGHHTVAGDVAMRPIRFGTALPLLSDHAIEPPARVTATESAEFVATGMWLAERAFDLSRPDEYQRPPMVLSNGPAVRSEMRVTVRGHLHSLGITRDEAARLTERMFHGPAYAGTSVIEVREAPEERVAGYGRTTAIVDWAAEVDPRQVASALLRRGMPRPAPLPPAARAIVINELLSSGPAIAEELAAQLAVPIAGKVPSLTLLDLDALLLAEAGWTPVPSLARLARALLDAPAPRVALVRLRSPDHAEHTSALAATTEGVRWVDLAKRRPLPAGEIPDFVRHAASASVLAGRHVRHALWSPVDAPTPPPLKVRLYGELLHLIDEQGSELSAARGFGYQVAALLGPPGGAHPAVIELTTLLYDQLAALLLNQIGPASPVFSVERPAMLWAAAGPAVQRLFRQGPVIRRLFAQKFVAQHPNYLAELRAERDVPPRPRNIWPVTILGRYGLPLFTAARYADEFLNPDPTKPRLDPPPVRGAIALQIPVG
jgi:hypothetical protein